MRRPGYTLIELLVAMALIMMIMSILTQAYVAGMDTFSKLKGIGDMSEKLREAASILRRDLAADHFTGAARISDPSFFTNPPREGFFQANCVSHAEGFDANNNPSWLSNPGLMPPGGYLHFTVRLRGNRQQEFFLGDFPSPTWFNQPPDGTYGGGYQWAELAYYLLPINSPPAGPALTSPGSSGPRGAPAQQLYALYRAQRAIVANTAGAPPANAANFPHMSISRQGFFNTPSTVQDRRYRGWQGPSPQDALLLADVLNFDVQVMPASWPIGSGVPNFFFNADLGALRLASDSYQPLPGPSWPLPLRAVKIIIRVYDLKSRQTRQITVVQDL